MCEGRTIQIKFCVWHNLLKADFRPSHNQWCFETRGRLSLRIKWSTTRRRSIQGRALRITQCLFLSLWHKMKCTKYSHWKSFLKSSFYECETMKNYTLLNKHSVSVITVVHRLTDSKNKIIKNIIWTSGPSPHMPKAQPHVQLVSI